jgi:hypothetical protein
MPRTLLIWMWIGVMATCLSASGQVYKFRCFQQASYQYQHVGDTSWVDTSYAVVVDFEKKKVQLRNKANSTFDITNYQPLRNETNGNTIVTDAVDRKGNQCLVELTLFQRESFHIATLVVRYPHIIYSYRLRRSR